MQSQNLSFQCFVARNLTKCWKYFPDTVSHITKLTTWLLSGRLNRNSKNCIVLLCSLCCHIWRHYFFLNLLTVAEQDNGVYINIYMHALFSFRKQVVNINSDSKLFFPGIHDNAQHVIKVRVINRIVCFGEILALHRFLRTPPGAKRNIQGCVMYILASLEIRTCFS